MPSSPPQQIPQSMRAEINEKILFAIDSGKDLIPAESIYNCYTGIGGLHNLKQSDFANYNEYANAKKEFEMSQFFTSHEVCRNMVEMLSPHHFRDDTRHVLRHGQLLQPSAQPAQCLLSILTVRPSAWRDTSTRTPISRNATSGNIIRNNDLMLSSAILPLT